MGIGDMTRQIMSAWDDEEKQEPTDEVEESSEEAEPEVEAEPTEQESEERLAEDESEEEETTDEEEDDEEEAEEEAEVEAEEELEVTAGFETEDPEVLAYLSRYQGDPEKALKAAAELTRTLNRQGQEKNNLAQRVTELEAELEQQTAFQNQQAWLTEEQANWVEQALDSGNQRGYVQQAVAAGEFDLARAVCARWYEEAPYEAMRASQAVDRMEQGQAANVGPEQTSLPYPDLVQILVSHFPDMPQYEQKMVSTLAALGEQHPLVQDARSNDPEVQARGIIGVYEIARAQTASVSDTKSKLKAKHRQDADSARRDAVVSSAQATPSPGETPRPKTITPGLTLEQLDAEFARK